MAAKKKKPEPEKKPQLFLYYSESRSGGEICEGQEKDDWPSYETAYIELAIIGLFRDRQTIKGYCEVIDVDDELIKAEKLYLALIRYGDGDTFGNSEGHTAFLGVAVTREDAQKLIDEALNDKSDTYRPWTGYFNTLEGSDVVPLRVDEEYHKYQGRSGKF